MPTGTTSQPLEHTFGAPPFAEASVVDAMRMGVPQPPNPPNPRPRRCLCAKAVEAAASRAATRRPERT